MSKKFLSMIVAATMLLGTNSVTFANDEVPSAPLNVCVPVAATTYSSISILWDKPENYKNITGYKVYLDGNPLSVTASNETYYTADNLEPDTEYTFEVTSLVGENESEKSDVLTAKTDKKGKVHDVRKAPYNDKGDGITLDTEAIQSAIDACEDNDVVLIPEEYTFLTGALDLKSNMTLEVNGTLLSSKNASDFEKKIDDSKTYTGGTATGVIYTEEAPKRLIWSRIEGWEQYAYRSLINVGYLDEETDYSTDENFVCQNVKIIGKGTITGDDYRANYAPINGNATALAIDEGKSADTFYDIDNSETSENYIRSRIRGRLINVSNAQNVYIKGVTVAKPPMWTIHMIYSDRVTTNGVKFNKNKKFNHKLDEVKDSTILLKLAKPALENKENVKINIDIFNTDRTFGTILGSEITRRYKTEGLPEDTVWVKGKGTAGQSFGAFIPNGLTLEVEGDGNDYVGKGLSGGKIIVYQPKDSKIKANENIIIGNVALYGATSGKAFFSGVVGERFCVRNSGAISVVEGCGAHGCEYMTGGKAVVLGETGINFAAGMSGGIAYVLDESGNFDSKVNKEMVIIESLDKDDINFLKEVINEHKKLTKSVKAKEVIDNFDLYIAKIKKVIPKDYKEVLELVKSNEEKGVTKEQSLVNAFYEKTGKTM